MRPFARRIGASGEMAPDLTPVAIVHDKIPALGRGALKENPSGTIAGADPIENRCRTGAVGDIESWVRPELDGERLVGSRIQGRVVGKGGVYGGALYSAT